MRNSLLANNFSTLINIYFFRSLSSIPFCSLFLSLLLSNCFAKIYFCFANCCRRKFECEYQEDKLNFKTHFSWVRIHLSFFFLLYKNSSTQKCRYFNDDNNFLLLHSIFSYMSKQYLSFYVRV